MFSQDALGLALSDAALVLSTGICVPYAIALKKGWIPYYWMGVVLQHLIQTCVLTATVVWTFNRQWPWVQSGYLTLHALVRHESASPQRQAVLTDSAGHGHEDAFVHEHQWVSLLGLWSIRVNP